MMPAYYVRSSPAWWLGPRLLLLRVLAALSGTQPDPKAVDRLARRAMCGRRVPMRQETTR